MKATGEVMSIGTTLEESLLKAIRSLEIGVWHLHMPEIRRYADGGTAATISQTGTDDRIYAIAQLIRIWGAAWNRSLSTLPRSTCFFLDKLRTYRRYGKDAQRTHRATRRRCTTAKQMGFSRHGRSRSLWKMEEEAVLELRSKLGMFPVYKMIDTCAGEFDSYIPYFYSTYEEGKRIGRFQPKKKIIVLGSGPIRIGQGVEFDYSTVHAVNDDPRSRL